MGICRTNRNAKLAAGLLRGHFVLPANPDPNEWHATEQYERELRLNARHVELIESGMDWMEARKQARMEVMG